MLVVRKVDETNRDSTFAELQAAVFRMFGEHYDKVWNICRSPLSLECRLTDSRIIFRGMKDDGQREKVKSITFKTGKLTWIWIEEATELTSADVDILDDRLRGELPNPRLFYQITMTFNPISSTHWIKARYFDRKDPEILAHHSTYLGKGDFSERKFSVVFNTDMPVNETDVITNCKNSAGLISSKTILENHPWVKSAEEEQRRIDDEKQKDSDSFGGIMEVMSNGEQS